MTAPRHKRPGFLGLTPRLRPKSQNVRGRCWGPGLFPSRITDVPVQTSTAFFSWTFATILLDFSLSLEPDNTRTFSLRKFPDGKPDTDDNWMSYPFDNCVCKTEEVKHKPDIFRSFGRSLWRSFRDKELRNKDIDKCSRYPSGKTNNFDVKSSHRENFWENYRMRSRMRRTGLFVERDCVSKEKHGLTSSCGHAINAEPKRSNFTIRYCCSWEFSPCVCWIGFSMGGSLPESGSTNLVFPFEPNRR